MKMLTNATLCTLFAAFVMTGCEYNRPRQSQTSRHEIRNDRPSDNRYESNNRYSRMGRVDRIDVVSVSSHTSGAGAILGAILGGVVGNQVGGGDGRKVATGAGVVGGALLGNEIEKRQRRDDEMYRVDVHFDNGGNAQFDYRRIDDLQVGDRVRVDNGEIYRL
jgi:outer membrane lipoprotein SlyB